MENKNQYQALLRGKVAAAISEARSVAVITHQGVKGAILEILIGKLFKPLLPADFGVGTGQIIDSYGSEPSQQVDIVIYNKSILPPVLVDDSVGLFPIESVLYTIEVKTTLNAKELSYANEAARKIINNFHYLHGKEDANGNRIEHKISKPRAVVFALNTNLKTTGMSEAERYKKTYKNGVHYLSAICVAGREYCYDDRECWVSMRNTEGFDEILNFIAGITNTYRSVSDSRGFPLLGQYVASDRSGYDLIPCTTLPELALTCEQCGNKKRVICTFNTPDFNIVDGTITDKDLCECGGKLISKKGNFTIKGGRVREIHTE